MSTIILAAPCIPGEVAPLLTIARHFAGRGDDVRMIGGTEFAEQIESAGARMVPFTGAADITEAKRVALMEERAQVEPGADQLNLDWQRFFVDPITEGHRLIQELLHDDPASVLIANSVFLGAWPVAFGAPGLRPRRWIGIGANPVVRASVDSTPTGPIRGLPDAERIEATRQANAGFAAALEPTRVRLEAVLRSLGATGPVQSLLDGFVEVPDVFANLSVAEFDFPRSDDPDSLIHIGILPSRSPAGWTAPSWWHELDAGRPVVVVTQGTIANIDLTELVAPTLAALADSDVLVVAALGRELAGSGLQLPSNARAEPFIPFAELLPKADVLVTNGGFGGTQQSLANGVPVVMAGVTEDKPMTAARVAHHGVGIDLGTARPSPEQIREASMTALNDDGIRSATARLASAYQAHDALGALERLVDGS